MPAALAKIPLVFFFIEILWIKVPCKILPKTKEWPNFESDRLPDLTISPIFKYFGAIIYLYDFKLKLYKEAIKEVL